MARLNVRPLIMLAALAALASPAAAEEFVRTSHCDFSGLYGYSNCTTTWREIAEPVRDLRQERLDEIARQQEDAKWEAFCKPAFHTDQYGVRRASYAKPGCEFGRTE
jgi:hypothetical protein